MKVHRYSRIQLRWYDVFLCDLDFDRMTLTYKLDLDIQNIYPQTKNCRSSVNDFES